MKTLYIMAVFIPLLGADAAEYGAAQKVGFNLPRNGISVFACEDYFVSCSEVLKNVTLVIS